MLGVPPAHAQFREAHARKQQSCLQCDGSFVIAAPYTSRPVSRSAIGRAIELADRGIGGGRVSEVVVDGSLPVGGARVRGDDERVRLRAQERRSEGRNTSLHANGGRGEEQRTGSRMNSCAAGCHYVHSGGPDSCTRIVVFDEPPKASPYRLS